MFRRLIEKDTLPHAILLHGRSKDKLTLEAKALADQLASGPDLFEYQPEGKLAMHTVENMHALKQEAFLPCYLGTKKVFIVYEVDRLHPHAAHALLKVFEEPPSGVHFILTTLRREKTLPTILSRCQTFWVPGQDQESSLSDTVEGFLSVKKYQDSRPFFSAIKAIADEMSQYEDPLEFQQATDELWEKLEARHPEKAPFFEEARFKQSRSTGLQVILESLFIKLGYL